MSAGIFTAAEVMDRAAGLLNDYARTIYTYTAQLPHLRTAMDALKQEFQLNNCPVTNVSSQIIPLDIGVDHINPPGMSPPNYPGDLTEIQEVWQRLQDSEEQWMPLRSFEYMQHNLDTLNVGPYLLYYSWQQEIIKFPVATVALEIKLDFISEVVGNIENENDYIGIINTKNALAFKTAELCARFLGENPTRANELKLEWQTAIDTVIRINIKGKQNMPARKRPFRSGYRNRNII